MNQKQLRKKKCRICKNQFQTNRPMQAVCSPKCAIEYVQKLREKRYRKEYRDAKQKLKSRSDWLREAQAVFNKYIRLRDKEHGCISCNRQHEGQYHAGHYRSVGAAPELRFDENNVHKQCAPCNNYLSGNAIEYRINLIKRIGLDKVEQLEGPQESKKYTINDIKEIKAEYLKKIKELEQNS